MLNIFKYSMIYTFKKKSTWILLALLGLVAWGIPYSIANSSMGDGAGSAPRLSVIFSNPLNAISFYIFYSVMLMSYLSVKSLNINKDGEEDGSTLLLVSKKFTRGDIVFGRFFAVIAHLVFAAAAVFGGMFLADMLMEGPSGMDYVLSLFVGTLIIGAVFVSFATLLSTTAGRVGTMFISIVVAFGMVIGNTIFMPMGAANQVNDGNFAEVANISIGKNGELVNSVNSNDERADSYIGEKYRIYSKFDIWYQLSSTLLLFTDEDVRLEKVDYVENSAGKIESIKKDITVPIGTGDDMINIYLSFPTGNTYMNLDSSDFYFEALWSDIAKEAASGVSPEAVKEIADVVSGAITNHRYDGNITAPTISNLFDIASLLTYDFMDFEESFDSIKDGTQYFNALPGSNINQQTNYEFLKGGNDIASTSDMFDRIDSDDFTTYAELMQEYKNQALAFSVVKEIATSEDYATEYATVIQPDLSTDDEGRFRGTGSDHSEGFAHFDDADFASEFVATPYIAKTTRMMIWIGISSLMFMATLIIYYRRDFR